MVERTTQSVQESATEAYRAATDDSASEREEERRTQREATEALEEATADEAEQTDNGPVDGGGSGADDGQDGSGGLDIQGVVSRGRAAAGSARETAERQVERLSGGVNFGSDGEASDPDLSQADRARRERSIRGAARAVEADQQTDRRDPFGLQDLDRPQQRQTVGRLRNKATSLERASRAGRRQARERKRSGGGAQGTDTGPLGVVGAGNVVKGARSAIDKGVTAEIDEVRIPGTAGRVPIPEQEVRVSGQGLASFSSDVRQATGLATGPPTGREAGDGLLQRGRRVEAGAADFQQSNRETASAAIDRLERRRREADTEGLPNRSVFSVAPASPAPVTSVLGIGGTSVTGGASAGGTGAAGGGGTATGTATGTASSSTALRAGTLLASIGATAGITRDGGELPAEDRFGEPELNVPDETMGGSELNVNAGSDPLGAPDLETGETGPQPTRIGLGDVLGGAEIPLNGDSTRQQRTQSDRADTTPDDFPLRDDRVNAGGDTGSGAPALSARQVGLGQQQESDLEDEDEEFILDESTILDRRPEPDRAINNQRITQDPEVNPTVRGLVEQIEAQEGRVREEFQQRDIDFGRESEPEATVGQDPLNRAQEDTSVGIAERGITQTDVLVATDQRSQQRPLELLDSAQTPSVSDQSRTDIQTRTRTPTQDQTANISLPDFGNPTGNQTIPEYGNPTTPGFDTPFLPEYPPETPPQYGPGEPPRPPRRPRDEGESDKKKREDEGFLNFINQRETFDTVSAGEFLGADLFGGEE